MTIEELRTKILDIRGRNGDPRLSWSQVHRAIVPEGSREQVSVACVYRVAREPGYEPRDLEIRSILGLDRDSPVVFVDGRTRPRAQAVGAQRCGCGQWFVSNHPRRRKCFRCSPFRGKVLER